MQAECPSRTLGVVITRDGTPRADTRGVRHRLLPERSTRHAWAESFYRRDPHPGSGSREVHQCAVRLRPADARAPLRVAADLAAVGARPAREAPDRGPGRDAAGGRDLR